MAILDFWVLHAGQHHYLHCYRLIPGLRKTWRMRKVENLPGPGGITGGTTGGATGMTIVIVSPSHSRAGNKVLDFHKPYQIRQEEAQQRPDLSQ